MNYRWGMKRAALVFVFLGFLFNADLAAFPPNSVTLRGGDGTSRPVTLSRVFRAGELPRCAQARLNGALVPTQCDVKTRWPDGSLQHAVLSFWAAPGSTPLTVDFVDQPVSAGGGLTPAQLLSNGLPVGARIELTNPATGASASADLRQMLTAGWVRPWLSGSIVTQFIVEDRSAALGADLSWGGQSKNLHPLFLVTAYPGWSGVQVDYILENTWTTKLADQSFDLTLRDAAGTAVFRKAGYLQAARTRWRKRFWSGTAPKALTVDYNLPYLIASRVLPNYDLSKRVPASAVDSEASAFAASDQGELGGSGQWQRYFPTTGGRPDIGLLPRWVVRYLYTFDARLEAAVLGNGGVSGYVPVHYRESLAGRYFDGARTTDAFGKPLSIDARPSVRTEASNADTEPADLIKPVKSLPKHGWEVDLSHQGSFAYVPYLITGDYYFLEELFFWASYNLAKPNPDGTVNYGRHWDWGYLNGSDIEMRGMAWSLRTLAHAAFFAPDGSPEKAYFTEKLTNNLAIKEGVLDIRDGAFYDSSPTSKWSFGRTVVAGAQPNPLHFLGPPNVDLQVSVDPAKTVLGDQPWMVHFNLVVLGHIRELGFAGAAKVQEVSARFLISEILNPAYNPYLAGSYYMPVWQPNSTFFTDWGSVKGAFTPTFLSTQANNQWPEGDEGDVEHGYPHIARAAASFGTTASEGTWSGLQAWNWLTANIRYQDLLNDNPKWAIIPRN